MAETSHKQNKRLPSVGYVIVLALIAFVGWHLYLTNSARKGVYSLIGDRSLNDSTSISLNPFTNLVSITIEMEHTKNDNNPFVFFGDGLLKVAIQLIGPGVLENQLNTTAREHYDLYAILVPYKVKILMEEADSEAAARLGDEKGKKRQEEARIKKEEQERKQKEMLSYIGSSLELEGLRVGNGSRFGQEVTGVFGTIVNKGDKALSKIKIRIYFLNAKRERIGETDYYPVLVSKYSLGLADQSPLRQGYRRDFGYSVEKDAPSGWSKKIEAEIVEIEVDQTPVEGNTKRTSKQAKRIQPGEPVESPTTGAQPQQEEGSPAPFSKSKPQTLQEVTPAAPPETRPKAARAVPDTANPESLISLPPSNVEDILERADDALNRSVKVSPKKAPPSGASHATPKTSEEINTLLGKVPEPVLTPTTGKPTTPPEKVAAPSPKPASPSMSEQIKEMLPTLQKVPPVETAPPKREPSPDAAMVASAPPVTVRAATLERCPQKAKKYCPLLEAAINRAWTADTNPGVRAVLESAGNSTATIRIVIQPDGKIQDIKVSQSSRNPAYDRAVLSVLGELRTLPPLPEEMRGEPFVSTTSFTYTRRQE